MWPGYFVDVTYEVSHEALVAREIVPLLLRALQMPSRADRAVRPPRPPRSHAALPLLLLLLLLLLPAARGRRRRWVVARAARRNGLAIRGNGSGPH